MASIVLDGVSHRYQSRPLPTIDGLCLSLAAGEIGCLLGPSGCGKTTVLRVIAGFERIKSGTIAIDGECVADATTWVPPEKRRIGMVFQDFALFPHLSVRDNIGFALTHLARRDREQRLAHWLALTQLDPLTASYPHQLSGGQQQRVALARALAPAPRLLLMDEAFSSLDSTLRQQLAMDVRHLLKSEGITALMVTHDQSEAFALADRVGVIDQGHLAQWDTPELLYQHPASRAVAAFIGDGAFVAGQIDATGKVDTALGKVSVRMRSNAQAGSNTAATTTPNCPRVADQVEVLLRPHDLVFAEATATKVVVRASVCSRVFHGNHSTLTLRLNDGTQLVMDAPAQRPFAEGETVDIGLATTELPVFVKPPAG